MDLTPELLVRELSLVVDPALARAVVESYVEMQRRFLAGDWQPAELDGGRLGEAVSRGVYQLDSGTATHSQLPAEIKRKLLDEDRQLRAHQLDLKDRQHISKAIDLVYKFRSDRGAVHISPTYTANFMDSMLVIHAGKWILAEFLRIAWKKDRETIAAVIEQLVQLEHSLIHELDGKPMVLAKGISAPEEILLLLFHAPGNCLTRSDLRDHARQKPQNVDVAVSRLLKAKDIRTASDGTVSLTPLGQKRVLEAIMPKWAPKR